MLICVQCGEEFPNDDVEVCPSCAAPTVKVRKRGDSLDGRVIADRYVLLEQLGSGGMGSVYRAKHRKLDSMCAVKILRLRHANRKAGLSRFYGEAKNTSKLKHPHNVRVFDFGHTDDGLVFLVMELLEGGSLANVVLPMPPERALYIMMQICRALGEAHQLGLIHRDLKPENVMLTEVDGRDYARVVDYGIAKLESSSTALTADGGIVGTPEYLSPEQAMGEKVDRRSDIYALGLLLYELVTAHLPFEGDTPLSLAVKHKTETPPPPSKFGPIDSGLEKLILQCLEKTREARPQTVEELGQSMQQLYDRLTGNSSYDRVTRAVAGDGDHVTSDTFVFGETVPTGHPSVIWTPRSRRPLIAAVIVAVAAAILIVVNPFGGEQGPSVSDPAEDPVSDELANSDPIAQDPIKPNDENGVVHEELIADEGTGGGELTNLVENSPDGSGQPVPGEALHDISEGSGMNGTVHVAVEEDPDDDEREGDGDDEEEDPDDDEREGDDEEEDPDDDEREGDGEEEEDPDDAEPEGDDGADDSVMQQLQTGTESLLNIGP